MASFLRIFQTVMHGIEAAAVILGPIVKAVDPEIGSLMSAAVTTAVVVEGAITLPGPQKGAIVSQVSAASIDLANKLLVSQGKKPLSADVQAGIDGAVKVVVDQLDAVANQVQPIPAQSVPLAVAAGK